MVEIEERLINKVLERQKSLNDLAFRVLNSYFYPLFLKGHYDDLLEMDVEGVVDEYNVSCENGDFSALYSEEADALLTKMKGLLPTYVTSQFNDVEELLKLWDYFVNVVKYKKRKGIYNSRELFLEDRFFSSEKNRLTYREIFRAFRSAKKFNDDLYIKSVELILFWQRNYNIVEQIETRRRLNPVMKRNPINSQLFGEALSNTGTNDGLVGVYNSNGVYNAAGEIRVNIPLSEIVGSFCKNDADYLQYSLSDETLNEKGFILWGDYFKIVSLKELLDNSIDPERVGWQPLSIYYNPSCPFFEFLFSEGSVLKAAEDALILKMK